MKKLRKTENSPQVGGGGSSKEDERNSILLAKVGGGTEQTVGNEAGNWSTGGGSQEVFLDHHFLEEWDCDVCDGRHKLHGSVTAAGVVVREAVRESPELESRVAGEGGRCRVVLEQAAVVEVGDDEGDVEFS